MTYRGPQIGRSGHSEQLTNDPRARRNGQIQSVPELDVGAGLEVSNTGRVSVKPGAKVVSGTTDMTGHRANLNPGYLNEHQTTSDPDITGSTGDSLTNLKAGVLSVESKLNAALVDVDEATNSHVAFYNAALASLQQEVNLLRSLIASLRNGGFVIK